MNEKKKDKDRQVEDLRHGPLEDTRRASNTPRIQKQARTRGRKRRHEPSTWDGARWCGGRRGRCACPPSSKRPSRSSTRYPSDLGTDHRNNRERVRSEGTHRELGLGIGFLGYVPWRTDAELELVAGASASVAGAV